MHNQQEVAKPHLQTDFPEADLAIPVHVFDSIKSGHRKILTVTNDTDITVELLYYLTFFKQHGLEELWILAGRGESSSFQDGSNALLSVTSPLHINWLRLYKYDRHQEGSLGV